MQLACFWPKRKEARCLVMTDALITSPDELETNANGGQGGYNSGQLTVKVGR
ncbi:hypothetical protein [Citrobacter freundii]|uniref:hypothetical protein n=1 Tax=Citrobacter freundii TaxID=546 RepID=UPI0028BDF241|nr:hypothetical protein [Citrobacter freundii]MDT7448144.1 hypothetical protein [Citrobacter freundii]